MMLDPDLRRIGDELKQLDAHRTPVLTVEQLLRPPAAPVVLADRAPTRAVTHIRWLSAAAAIAAAVLVWRMTGPGDDPAVVDRPPVDRTTVAPQVVSTSPTTGSSSVPTSDGAPSTSQGVETPAIAVTQPPATTVAPQAADSTVAPTTAPAVHPVETTAAPATTATPTSTVSAEVPVPVASWTFDSAAVEQVSEVGGISLTVGDGAASVPGRSGSAVSYSGAYPSAAVARGPLIDTSRSFTVSTVMQVATLRDCIYQGLVSQDGATVSGFELGLSPGCSPEPPVFMFTMPDADSDAAIARRLLGASTVTPGRWYHVVGVHDAERQELRLYVDGVLEVSGPAPAEPWNAKGAFAVGRARFSAQPRDYFFGAIDTTAVYQEALTEAQIAAL